ncbi:MAG: DUF4280 domain-containing protein [Lachnospiraceae bacterium]|nr:DUF4280 domain-containing protein [Lachnospiraceae bacterium]
MGSEQDEPKYITRLMKMECSMGTVQNYINVGQDHGILAGGNCDAQPVMNANDHTSKNVIHFGHCKSEENPERAFRETLVKALMGPMAFTIGDKVMDKLEELGIISYKCKPNTPQPWTFANEDCILEGAPALTMDSQLACRYGGMITFVKESSTDEETAEEAAEAGEDEQTPVPEDVVGEAFNEAVAEAMGEIAELGEAGEETVEKVQTALALASAMPPQEGGASASIQSSSGVSSAVGAAAAALYNTVRILEPDTEMTFQQAAGQMESYGTLEHPELGTVSLGIADALNRKGYRTQYCFGTDIEAISREAANAEAAIMMYATTKDCGCVAFRADPVNAEAKERTFSFYNEEGLVEESMTLKSFDNRLSGKERTKLGTITLTVDKPDKQPDICDCAECSRSDIPVQGGE